MRKLFVMLLLLWNQQLSGQITSIPFCDDFEISNSFWTPDSTNTGSNWVIGTPQQSTLNSAYSGSHVLGIDLIGTYLDSTTAFIYSMPFDFTNISNPKLKFWQNRNTEAGYDGINIQYSIDGGITWSVIGTGPGDLNGTNWYTSQGIFSNFNEPVWDGLSNGWIESTYYLGATPAILNQPNVLFRFKFTSDYSFTLEGINIDNFCIEIPCNDDLKMISSTTPLQYIELEEGSSQSLLINIENRGNAIQSQADISYQINSGPVVTFLWQGWLLPGANLIIPDPYSFIVPASGPFNICTWVTLPGDCDNSNDTICNTYVSLPTLSLNYCDDFENGNIGWVNSVDPTSGPNTNWELGTPAFGQTSSAHSGNTAWDINLNSGYQDNALVYLYSPFFDFSTTAAGRISFSLNYNIDDRAGVYLEYSNNGGNTWSTLGGGSIIYPDPCGKNWYTVGILNLTSQTAWSGSSGGWINCTYELCCANNIFYNPLAIQFRFVFTSYIGWSLDGVSMDDFCVTQSNGDNIGIEKIIIPKNTAPANYPTNIYAKITNYGSTILTAVDFNYSINGINNATPISWTGSLAPCASDTIVFTNVLFPLDTNTLCVFTNLLTDINSSDDTLCQELIGLPVSTLNYCNDFESSSTGWLPSTLVGGNSATNWELGLPAYGNTNSAFSGIKAWDTNLNSKYGGGAQSVLYSPYFDFSLVNNAILSFAMNFNSFEPFDGTRVEFSNDAGINWYVLGTGTIVNPDPCGKNWYTNSIVLSSSKSGWSGNSGGWFLTQYKLCCTSGILNQPYPIQFRFVFTSDDVVLEDGVSMDDFCITTISGNDAGVSQIIPPNDGVISGSVIPVTITLSNYGSTNLTNTDIYYSINGLTQPVYNWSGNIPPCGEINISLPGITINSGDNIICVWTNLTGDVNNTNDSLCSNIVGIPTITPEFVDNFDNANIGWYAHTYGSQSTKWERGTPAYGLTSGAKSGTQCWDINLTTAFTHNSVCMLYSPFFDISSVNFPKLSFWRNQYTEITFDGIYLEYSIDSGINWQKLGTLNDTNGVNWYTDMNQFILNTPEWSGYSGGWKRSEYNLNVLDSASILQFRFVFFTSNYSTIMDGVSIDDFGISIQYSEDASLESFITPGALATTGSIVPVEIILKNSGASTINNLDISYIHNGFSPVIYNWTGNLTSGNTTSVSLTSLIAASGTNYLTAYIDWPSDLNANNDSIQCTFQTVNITQTPYTDDFESGNILWTNDNVGLSGTEWELGIPNYGQTSSSHSGLNCWDINLNTAYSSIANSRLYSPYFDLSNSTNINLSFWLNYESELFHDGMRIEYTNNGSIWQVLGTTSDPNGTNWYNGTINPQSKPGWSGNSGGWVQSNYITQQLNGNSLIQFRFVFTSDINLSGAGFSMDDFSMTQTVGINELKGDNEITLYPNPVHDILQIECAAINTFTGRLTIHDAGGKTIYSQDIPLIMKGSKIEVSTKQFAPGVYYIIISGKNEFFRKSFIKD